MENLYGWLIAFGILGSQYYLSRRNSVYWGAFLPIAYIAFLIVIIVRGFHGGIPGLIVSAVVGLLILCAEWGLGRDDVMKKRKKELEKIQVNDL